jgi:hypothetical protein
VLDAITLQYSAVNDPVSMSEWKVALEHERSARVERYDDILAALRTTVDSERNREYDDGVLREIETEEQQEEVLTLLKAAIDKYGDDVLALAEIEVTQTAFQIVADRSSTVIMSLPSWLVMPFEFSSTFGLSRWGNDTFVPEHSDTTRFIHDVNVWSRLNHPHVAKFLGACHVGRRPFIVHKRVRTLSEFVHEVKDRKHTKFDTNCRDRD